MSLRQGPPPDDREMYATHVDEVEKLARSHGLAVIRVTRGNDRLGREGVTWQTVFLQAPDDGLGALPLLRHVIVNDSKSSTYKLALLRVLVRIADSATGLVEDVDDDTVAVPLGLVALYWIRAFKPLVEQGLPQKPPNRNDTGLGFVKEGFRALRQVSPFSLRLGARFTGVRAPRSSPPCGMLATPSLTCRLTTSPTPAKKIKSSLQSQRGLPGPGTLHWMRRFSAR